MVAAAVVVGEGKLGFLTFWTEEGECLLLHHP